MIEMTKSEFLAFLHAEKGRIDAKYTKPGWSNWAFAGAFVTLAIYLFDLLKTNMEIHWSVVLMLTIGLLSMALIMLMIYPIFFPKTEIYFPNRISTLWQEAPILEITLSGLSFSAIFIFLLLTKNYSWILYVFGYISLERIISLILLYYRRNKLTISGLKFYFLSNSIIFNNAHLIISIIFYTSIAIYSVYFIVPRINLYLTELQISAGFIGLWVVIFAFFKSNLTTHKLSNGLDNIIDKTTYSNMSQQDAMDELMFLRYGGDAKQVVNGELTLYFTLLSKLSDINAALDVINKNIEEGKLNPENYYNWSRYLQFQSSIINDAIKRGKDLNTKIYKLQRLPNNVTKSTAFEELLKITQLGIEKLEATTNKFSIITKQLYEYQVAYYCRKSGGVCETMNCTNRNDKMSMIYALKAFPFKYAIRLIIQNNRH